MGQMKDIGGVPGYWAPAAGGSGPALIVIQEWWGLDAQTKSIADRLATEGYNCFAPDFFRGELAALGDGQAAMSIMQKHAPHTESDVVAVFDALKKTGKVGTVGFCFGGRVSLALGVQRKPDALVTFYGGGMQTLFDRMDGLHSPVLAFFGDKDVSIPAGTIDEFKAILARQKVEHEVFVYPNSGHAFFRDSDPKAYRPEAAKDAWTRSKAFLDRHLR